MNEWRKTIEALFSARGACAGQMEVIPPHLHSGELGYRPGISQVLEGTAVRASQPAAGRRSEEGR